MARKAEDPRTAEVRDIRDARLAEWVYLKTEKDRIEKQQKDIRPTVVETIQDRGEADEKGNITLPLDTAVNGYSKFIYQKRVSRSVDAAVAETILRDAGLWERCAPPVPQVDLDEVFACRQEDLLTDEQLEEIYPAKESWAVIVRK